MSWTLRLTLLTSFVTFTSASCPTSDWKQFRDMCYWMPNYTSPWYDAKDFCQTYPGTDMASIHDLYIDAFIAQGVLEGYKAWLGLRRENDTAPWTWADRSPLNYTNWYGGEPGWGGEACTIINFHNDGDWTGYGCSNSFYFICQISAY